jgi:hypothetical protein
MNERILLGIYFMFLAELSWGVTRVVLLKRAGYRTPKRLKTLIFGSVGALVYFMFTPVYFNGFLMLAVWFILFIIGSFDLVIFNQEQKLLTTVTYIMSLDDYDTIAEDMHLFWAHDRVNNHVVVQEDIERFSDTAVIFAITYNDTVIAKNRLEVSHVLHTLL